MRHFYVVAVLAAAGLVNAKHKTNSTLDSIATSTLDEADKLFKNMTNFLPGGLPQLDDIEDVEQEAVPKEEDQDNIFDSLPQIDKDDMMDFLPRINEHDLDEVVALLDENFDLDFDLQEIEDELLNTVDYLDENPDAIDEIFDQAGVVVDEIQDWEVVDEISDDLAGVQPQDIVEELLDDDNLMEELEDFVEDTFTDLKDDFDSDESDEDEELFNFGDLLGDAIETISEALEDLDIDLNFLDPDYERDEDEYKELEWDYVDEDDIWDYGMMDEPEDWFDDEIYDEDIWAGDLGWIGETETYPPFSDEGNDIPWIDEPEQLWIQEPQPPKPQSKREREQQKKNMSKNKRDGTKKRDNGKKARYGKGQQYPKEMDEMINQIAEQLDMSPQDVKNLGSVGLIAIMALYCCVVTCLCVCVCGTYGIGGVKAYKTMKNNEKVFNQIEFARQKANERLDHALAIQQSAMTNPHIMNTIQQNPSQHQVIRVEPVPAANQPQLLTGRASDNLTLDKTTDSSFDEDKNLLV